MSLHLTEVIFWVTLAPSSSENRASKNLHVCKVVETKEVGRWSFKPSFRTLIVGLFSMVCWMTIFRAFLVAPFASLQPCLIENPHQGLGHYPSAMGFGVFLLKDKWFLTRCLEAYSMEGWMGQVWKVVVLIFCACFELGAFALVVERSSQATWPATTVSKPTNPKLEPAFTNKRFEVRGGVDLRRYLDAATSIVTCVIVGEEHVAMLVGEHHLHWDCCHLGAELPS